MRGRAFIIVMSILLAAHAHASPITAPPNRMDLPAQRCAASSITGEEWSDAQGAALHGLVAFEIHLPAM